MHPATWFPAMHGVQFGLGRASVRGFGRRCPPQVLQAQFGPHPERFANPAPLLAELIFVGVGVNGGAKTGHLAA